MGGRYAPSGEKSDGGVGGVTPPPIMPGPGIFPSCPKGVIRVELRREILMGGLRNPDLKPPFSRNAVRGLPPSGANTWVGGMPPVGPLHEGEVSPLSGKKMDGG